jgi:hypothetical protein
LWRDLAAAERGAKPRCRSSEGPRVGAAVQAALTMGYRSAGKVSTPPSPSGWVHRHLSCLVLHRWLQGGRVTGFTVVYAVDTGPPHNGHSRVPMWAARSERTHQRNGLAHGRDVPDVLREHGNFFVSSGAASTKQPSSSGSQGRAAADGVGLKSVPVFSIACMITASFRARATTARLKPSRFLNARAQLRSSLSPRTRVRIAMAAS